MKRAAEGLAPDRGPGQPLCYQEQPCTTHRHAASYPLRPDHDPPRAFLDPGPEGWTLFEVTGKDRDRQTRRFGPFTSVRHVLQQRQVKLPTGVKAELEALEEAAEAGEEAVGEMPEG